HLAGMCLVRMACCLAGMCLVRMVLHLVEMCLARMVHLQMAHHLRRDFVHTAHLQMAPHREAMSLVRMVPHREAMYLVLVLRFLVKITPLVHCHFVLHPRRALYT